ATPRRAPRRTTCCEPWTIPSKRAMRNAPSPARGCTATSGDRGRSLAAVGEDASALVSACDPRGGAVGLGLGNLKWDGGAADARGHGGDGVAQPARALAVVLLAVEVDESAGAVGVRQRMDLRALPRRQQGEGEDDPERAGEDHGCGKSSAKSLREAFL